MGKMRVYELSKELGMENNELIAKLGQLGVEVKSHSSSLDEKDVERVRITLLKDRQPDIITEERVTRSVIRRRARKVERPPVPPPTPEEEVKPAPEAEPPPPVEEVPVVAPPEPEEIPEKAGEPPAPEPEPPKPLIPEPAPPKPRIPEVPSITEPIVIKPAEKKPEEETKPSSQKRTITLPLKREIAPSQKPPPRPLPERPRRGRRRRPDRRLRRDMDGGRKRKDAVRKSSKKTEITIPKAIKRKIKISESISVAELAQRMSIKVAGVIKKLMSLGVMASLNQKIDADTAALVADEFNYEIEVVQTVEEDLIEATADAPESLKPRPPVVTIMGHVNHGKTLLLDSIRRTNVAEGEAGGITQHIGAYQVHLPKGAITFVDTPGHEAFTTMRARGAEVTDLVVLVVAADDGVMPQTRESVNHAKAAEVPIIVAINKMDLPTANPDRAKQALSEFGLVAEEWGGETLFAPVSAKEKTGINELLDQILLQAEMLELKVNPDKGCRGTVIEAKLDRFLGPVATVLIQEGTLKVGDPFICDRHAGKVRAMINDRGERVKSAPPSMPIEVLGFDGVPEAGTSFIMVEDEKKAREIASYREEKMRASAGGQTAKLSLEELYAQIQHGDVKELNLVVKADVQGSVEALKDALEKMSTEKVKLEVLHGSVGGITETDVMLASASNAIIVGFNVRPETKVAQVVDAEGVDLRLYSVIYEAISDIRKAMEGLLEPTYRETPLGLGEVIERFTIPRVGAIAGTMVQSGKMERGALIRVVRDSVVVWEGKIDSLRRYKDDVKEVAAGVDCGVKIENFSDVKVGDIIESYELEEVAPSLD